MPITSSQLCRSLGINRAALVHLMESIAFEPPQKFGQTLAWTQQDIERFLIAVRDYKMTLNAFANHVEPWVYANHPQLIMTGQIERMVTLEELSSLFNMSVSFVRAQFMSADTVLQYGYRLEWSAKSGRKTMFKLADVISWAAKVREYLKTSRRPVLDLAALAEPAQV